MKRLVRKASIQLEHATNLESFIGICQDGTISPYSMTNKSSKSYSNSLDQDSIYLSKSSGWEFALEMLDDDKYLSAVSLQVSADESNLLPAYDNLFEYGIYDIEVDENGEEYFYYENNKIYKNDLTWKDTLEMSEECRHKGQISVSNINSVRFFTQNNELNTIIPKNEVSITEAKEIIDLILQKIEG